MALDDATGTPALCIGRVVMAPGAGGLLRSRSQPECLRNRHSQLASSFARRRRRGSDSYAQTQSLRSTAAHCLRLPRRPRARASDDNRTEERRAFAKRRRPTAWGGAVADSVCSLARPTTLRQVVLSHPFASVQPRESTTREILQARVGPELVKAAIRTCPRPWTCAPLAGLGSHCALAHGRPNVPNAPGQRQACQIARPSPQPGPLALIKRTHAVGVPRRTKLAQGASGD